MSTSNQEFRTFQRQFFQSLRDRPLDLAKPEDRALYQPLYDEQDDSDPVRRLYDTIDFSEVESVQLVVLPSRTATKAALYLAMQHAGVNRVQLAGALRCDEKHVRRLLDPAHRSDLDQLERALAQLGKRIVVEIRDAA